MTEQQSDVCRGVADVPDLSFYVGMAAFVFMIGLIAGTVVLLPAALDSAAPDGERQYDGCDVRHGFAEPGHIHAQCEPAAVQAAGRICARLRARFPLALEEWTMGGYVCVLACFSLCPTSRC